MKKKFLLSAALLTVVAMGVSGYFSYTASTSSDNSPNLVLANAEAISDDSEMSAEELPCYSAYMIDPSECFIYCLDCSTHKGHPVGPVGKCK